MSTHTTKSPPRTHSFTIVTHSMKKHTCMSVCLSVCVCLFVRVYVKTEMEGSFGGALLKGSLFELPTNCTMFHK